MAEPMKPADVPKDLVKIASETWWDATRQALQWEDRLRTVLAAALSPYEQQIRQAIAAELSKLTTPCGTHRDRSAFDHRCASCQRYTALLGAQRLVLGRDGA